MASSDKDSISATNQKIETFRDQTRDYLLKAFELTSRAEQSGGFASRYYRLKVNSLLRRDDIANVVKTSERGLLCSKCGILKKIRLLKRRKQNSSAERLHCRYLRSILVEYCSICQFTRRYKLHGRQHLISRLRLQDNPKSKLAKTKQSTKKLPEVPTNQPTSSTKNRKKKPITAPTSSSSQPQFSSRLRSFSCLLDER